MIRRVNLVNLISHLNGKCPLLSRVIPSSYVCQKSSTSNRPRPSFDVKKTNYEDTFGNLDSFEQMFARINDDPEDIKEYHREKKALGHTGQYYIDAIIYHLNKHDYKIAINLLEVDMVNDKIPLIPYIYKVLISYNAKRGNLKEAYRLFINFKKRNGQVPGAMYTSMFNACANCRNSLLAIEKIKAVEECMRNDKHHSINLTNYNVLLKAYGRHADLSSCLKIMDEVLERKDKVNSCIYNCLLEACISDTNSGFRHALIVWRKMLQNLVKPDIYSFELLAKCAKNCSLGDTVLIPKIISDIKKESEEFFQKKVVIETVDGEKKRKILKIPASGNQLIPVKEGKSESPVEKEIFQLQSIESNEPSHLALQKGEGPEKPTEVSQIEMDNLEENKSVVVTESAENLQSVKSHPEKFGECKDGNFGSELPNLLALEPSFGSVVEFGVMTDAYHRFMLVGGVKGFLKTMAEFGVEPGLKTYTLLLYALPPTKEAEEEFMSILEARKVKIDLVFFNILLKRMLCRNEEHLVKEYLEKMSKFGIKPGLTTFEILANCCKTREMGLDLLKTLHNYGYRASIEILLTLLKKSQTPGDLNYVLDILRAAKGDDSDINPKFLATLHKILKSEYSRRRKSYGRQAKNWVTENEKSAVENLD